MAEYIDREAAYDVLTDYYHHSTDTQHEALREALSRVPAADVAPITKSRIVINNGRNVCFACCGEVSRVFKYCPWCGARYEVVDK